MKKQLFDPDLSAYRLVLIILAVMLAGQACKKDRCLKSIGKITSEERTLGDFYKVSLADDINLFIQQDSTNYVTVEAGANLMPWIVTEVSEGVLTIRDDNKCNWLRSFKKEINLYLHCRQPYVIEYSGAGDVKGMSTIVSDSIELNYWSGSGSITLDVQCRMVRVHQHTGPGDAVLTGTTKYASYYIRGNGELNCGGLKAEHVYVDAKGTNDAYVCSSYELAVRIGYIGNVYYYGRPQVIQAEVTERGQLFPLE